MLLNQVQAHIIGDANRKALLASKILAKAVLKLPDGSMLILTIYELSTTYQFYWTQTSNSKSARVPRTKWAKPSGFPKKNYSSFRGFVDNYASFRKAEILSFKIYNKKKLAGIMAKCHNDSISTNWHEAIKTPTPADVAYIHRKFKSKTTGGTLGLGWGK